ncbi:NADPH:quinone oxidoreductase family protein [Candidatus Binatia bacterium]|nr:NADPH:quinone oxidoreductase family protein [Candidatus Binatia bacterium]
MKAWTVSRYGAPRDVLQLVDRDPPAAGPGTLRIRVLVAGVSLPEVLMCRGAYPYKPPFPFTPGHEAVGVVLDPGDASGFAIGQRVMGVTSFPEGRGGHAEEALLLASNASLVPDTMSDEDAAAFTIGYQTAYLGLVVRAGLRAGETLLVHGAAGGTGFPAVQLGKALGARVIAVARGADKAERCRADGADHVIDAAACADGDWPAAVAHAAGAARVNVVFDPVGGEVLRRSLACLAYGGRLVAIGFASGAWGEVPTWELVMRNASLVGALAMVPDAATAATMTGTLASLYERGMLAPRVTEVHAFRDVPAALAALDERRALGKHVVRVSR